MHSSDWLKPWFIWIKEASVDKYKPSAFLFATTALSVYRLAMLIKKHTRYISGEL